MFTIDGRDKRPIYQQVIDKIILLIATGVMTEGEQLPSIRSLAHDLGINANTVAKAYTELEYKGIIKTIPKSGTYVDKVDLSVELKDKASKEIEELIVKYKNMGLSISVIEEIVEATLKNVTN